MVDDLEKELARRGHPCARSCDDCLSVVSSQRAGARVTASLTRLLQRHLKPELNEAQSMGGPTTTCTSLGFPFHGPRLSWSPEALQALRYRLRQLTGRSWGVARAYR